MIQVFFRVDIKTLRGEYYCHPRFSEEETGPILIFPSLSVVTPFSDGETLTPIILNIFVYTSL